MRIWTHWGPDKMVAILDTTFLKCILLNDVWIPIKISLKFVPRCLINNIPELVQVMACCLVGAMDGWFTSAYMRHPASMS